MSLDKIGAGTSQITFEANRSKTEDTKEQKIATDPQNNDTFMSAEAAAGIKTAAIGRILINKTKNKNAAAQKIIDEAQGALAKGASIAEEAQNVSDESSDIETKGKKVCEEGKRTYLEVKGYLEQGKRNNYDDITDFDGNPIIFGRAIVDGELGTVMFEYAKDGTLKRSTAVWDIMDGMPAVITDHAKKTKYRYNLDSQYNNRPVEVFKGYEKLSDGREKAAEKFGFRFGELENYAKGYEEQPDGKQKYAEVFSYDYYNHGQLSTYSRNFEESPDNRMRRDEKAAERFSFKDGKLEKYAENYENSGQIKKAGKELTFYSDGKTKSYMEGCKRTVLYDHSREETAKIFNFLPDGTPANYTENSECCVSEKGRTMAASKGYDFKENMFLKLS